MNTDTTKRYLRHIVRVSSLAANFGISVLRKIKEDLTVKHTVLVQVENLRSSTSLGLLDFPLLLSFSSFTLLLLGKFVLEGPLHLFHFLLVFAHLLFELSLHLSFSFGVQITGMATTTASFKLCLELCILGLKLTNQLGLRILVDRGLVLNLLCTIGIT